MTRSIHYHYENEGAPVYSGPSSMDSAFPLLDVFASDPATWLTEASRQPFRPWNAASGPGSTHQSPRRHDLDHCGMHGERRWDLQQELSLSPPLPTPKKLPVFNPDGPISREDEGHSSSLLAQASFEYLLRRVNARGTGEAQAESFELPPMGGILDPELDLDFRSSDANGVASGSKRSTNSEAEAIQGPHVAARIPADAEAMRLTTIGFNTRHDEAASLDMPQTAKVIQWPAAGPSHLPAPPKAGTPTAPIERHGKRAKTAQAEAKPSKTRLFHCELHNASYRGHSSFSRHKRTTSGHEEYKKPPQCMYCHKKVSRRDALTRHLSNSCRVVPRDLLKRL